MDGTYRFKAFPVTYNVVLLGFYKNFHVEILQLDYLFLWSGDVFLKDIKICQI